LAGRGHALAVLARGRKALEETRRELERLGARAVLALSLDIADAEAVESAAARIEAELGRSTLGSRMRWRPSSRSSSTWSLTSTGAPRT
jgi:NAD(P)-dependent dehydrogenase (short-subunit alcohol dehydrogenase family)